MLIGFTCSVIIFDFEVSVLALLFLSVGDAVAGLVGRALPIGKIWDKSISGSLSGFFVLFIFWISYKQYTFIANNYFWSNLWYVY